MVLGANPEEHLLQRLGRRPGGVLISMREPVYKLWGFNNTTTNNNSKNSNNSNSSNNSNHNGNNSNGNNNST